MTTDLAETTPGTRRRSGKAAKTASEQPLQAQQVAPVRTHRSVGWLFGGIALVVVGALVGAFLFTANSHTEKVWVVTKPIARGTTITPQDLGTISIAEGQSTAAIPFSETNSPAGKVATVDLPKGSMLTGQSVASQLAVPNGQALVGLALKPSQLPAQPLAAGDKIEIVQVNTTQGTGTTASTGPAQTISGVVSDTEPPAQGSSGTWVVDVLVSQTVAAQVTSLAASGQVAIYLISSEG